MPESTRALTLPAPAKLNLFLRITGRRADGYHELQTVFTFIDLADRITLKVRRDGEIRRIRGPRGVPEAADLVVRAAARLKAVTGVAVGADIAVEKHIPMGGGLGGGSSDAATVLHGLNHLWGTGLDAARLEALGLELGADVPVFVHGRATWAEGVGERFTPVRIAPSRYLLAFPGVQVPTGAVFAADDLTRDCPPLTIGGFPSSEGVLQARDLMAPGNVCEPVVERLFPAVGRCLRALASVGPARMTGTGATCFALLDADGTASEGMGGWEVRTARGLDLSPLASALHESRAAPVGMRQPE